VAVCSSIDDVVDFIDVDVARASNGSSSILVLVVLVVVVNE
jgi:hypothetical protein